MIITYHGESFIRIQHGDLTVAWNPIGKDAGHKTTRFGATLALVSYRDPAHQGIDQVTLGDKIPFVIDGPGEYEISNVFIQGFETPGPNGGINTIYTLSLDGLRLAHWGVLGEAKISESILSGIGEVDVLFTPLDGSAPSLVGPAAAYQLALTFQPKIIAPLSESEPILRQFLKEAGAENVKPLDKLILKRKDVLEKEGETVVLASI